MTQNLTKFKEQLILNNKSKSTIVNYLSRVKNFLSKIQELNQENINTFFLNLKETKAEDTYNSYKNAIKAYLTFEGKEFRLPKYIMIKRKLPKYITEEYFKKEVIPTAIKIFQRPLRAKALLYFMFYTGMRKGEVALLKREYIDLKNRKVIYYCPKTKEEKVTYFNKETRDIIKAYFAMEIEENNAFNSSITAITKKFEKLNEYIQDVNIHAHIFRHSFSSYYLTHGGTLEGLRQLLGHKSARSTERYSALKSEDIQQLYNKVFK